MQTKTIKALLRKKVDDWIESINDPALKTLVKENTIVTGGCIASLLMQEEYNDIDIYFRTFEVTKLVAEYYVKEFKKNPPPKFKDQTKNVDIFVRVSDSSIEGEKSRVSVVVKSAGIAGEVATKDYQYFETTSPEGGEAEAYVNRVAEVLEDSKKSQEEEDKKGKYRPIFLSTNAITLSHKVQLVLRFYGEPSEIHQNYDFDHCKSYWTSWNSNLVTPPEALLSILSKHLKYTGSLYPICSVIRTRKFLARGWNISAGQYLKMCFQISKLDLENFEVLTEQLVGVDQAYFQCILEALKAHDHKTVDGNYLMEVIDKLF